ncbi:hypothetical protein GCM10023310_00590 [Paenibacillus vulneris]|uniref:Uncharacterized protein n=1 Tax=Paenibacillus vulneris TaxID=1133364 RepID=A0ABW3UXH0_9BACL
MTETKTAIKAEWSQEVLFVKRDSNGAIIQIQENEPEGFESDVKWVQIETERTPEKRRYWD